MSQNDLKLVPYVEHDGRRTLTDSFLAGVFDEIVVEGMVSSVFYSGMVNTAADFVALMKNPANVPVFVLKGEKCVGFAWLNGIGANHAYGHFCYFDNEVSPLECGRAVLDYWWLLPLDVILGTVPRFNERAARFVAKLGFVKLGEIPNLCVNKFTGEKWPAVIFYLSRP